MAITIYQYPNCSTCRKALKWLDQRGLEYTSIDLVATPPTEDELRRLAGRTDAPLKKFFNTSGQSYRGGGFKDRLPNMSDDEKFAALAADGKLIKRPLVDTGASTLIGFKAAEWEAAL